MPKLTVFIEDGRLRMDNNLIENAIRPFVIGRKNFLFCDTVNGANASANLYSLIEPYGYLRTVAERQNSRGYRSLAAGAGRRRQYRDGIMTSVPAMKTCC